MTRPKVPPTSAFTRAMRKEKDCWEALVRHTATCPQCREVRRLGMGCDTGRAHKVDWMAAARKRFDLSQRYGPAQAKRFTDGRSAPSPS